MCFSGRATKNNLFCGFLYYINWIKFSRTDSRIGEGQTVQRSEVVEKLLIRKEQDKTERRANRKIKIKYA